MIMISINRLNWLEIKQVDMIFESEKKWKFRNQIQFENNVIL